MDSLDERANPTDKPEMLAYLSDIHVTSSHFPADLVTFAEEILNGKLHFLCSDFI